MTAPMSTFAALDIIDVALNHTQGTVDVVLAVIADLTDNCEETRLVTIMARHLSRDMTALAEANQATRKALLPPPRE